MASLEKDARRLVYQTKYAPARSGAHLMGKLLASKLPYLVSANVVVVPIPTTPSRIRWRGFDQAVYMAGSLSRHAHYRVEGVLARTSNEHQIGLGRKERFAHMQQALKLSAPQAIENKTVLLVDDVVTTGATMEAASKLLLQNGATKVIAVYFAKAV
jgi:ComF family protein